MLYVIKKSPWVTGLNQTCLVRELFRVVNEFESLTDLQIFFGHVWFIINLDLWRLNYCSTDYWSLLSRMRLCSNSNYLNWGGGGSSGKFLRESFNGVKCVSKSSTALCERETGVTTIFLLFRKCRKNWYFSFSPSFFFLSFYSLEWYHRHWFCFKTTLLNNI